MINGVPVNDMENGWVYWSNWDGLGDATSSIQVQRGLSAVNLAVPSIGGTMNMITDPTKMKKGVLFKQEFGSGGFEKNTLIANSGLIDDKYAFSFNVTRKTGDGVIDATWTDAWSYYLATSYNINEKNRLELYAAGAPQRHGQNLYMQNMATYNCKYAEDQTEYLTASEDSLYFAKFPEQGMQFNQNWAPVDPSYVGKQWWNGSLHDRYSPNFLNERENFYHKPQINLNWFTKLNEQLDVYSVVYYSGGKGGGTGTYGNIYRRDANGELGDDDYKFYYGPSPWSWDWDETFAMNSGPEGSYWVDKDSLYKETRQSLGILRNSVNQQWTIGAISKAYYTVNDNFKTSAGIDLRTAEIDHFREVRDLLGGDYFFFDGNDFDTADDYEKGLGDKIDYNNTNKVNWIGGYAQGEYSKEKLSATIMGGLSAVKYEYTDHFVDDGTGDELFSETDWVLGYQGKGGASYRVTDDFGFYGNAGYVNKCPIFDEVINDWTGELVKDPKNEKFTSLETGFNYVGLDGTLNVKGGFYFTNWDDQSKSLEQYIPDLDDEIKIFVSGIDSRHMGAEFEVHSQPLQFAKFDFSFSKGDWKYLNNLLDVRYEGAPGDEDTLDIYVKDLKVGDAPQTQIALGTTLFPVEGFSATVSYKYFCDFYATFDPFSRQYPNDTAESWEIPPYSLVDLHLSYDLPTIVKGFEMQAFAHIFNLLDETYVQDAVDNSEYNAFSSTHNAADAEVYFGLPRTFNAGVSLIF